MARLIDAEICLRKAWENFYKQEEEHQKNIKGYDIMRDQFYEQIGFECCQQTIVNAPTVDVVPISVLEDIKAEIKECQSRLNRHSDIYFGLNKALEIIEHKRKGENI